MTLTVETVLRRASILLQDGGAVRWTLSELIGWLNEGINHAISLKPDLATTRTSIPLAAGVTQAVPDTLTRIIRVHNNTQTGTVLWPISRELLDSYIPDWRNPNTHGAASDVEHAIFDEGDDTRFDVYPANDGTGALTVTAIAVPDVIEPDEAQPEDFTSYASVNLPFPDAVADALTDYIAARAYQKDIDLPAVAQRAALHYQTFGQKIGAEVNAEAMLRIEVPPTDPQA